MVRSEVGLEKTASRYGGQLWIFEDALRTAGRRWSSILLLGRELRDPHRSGKTARYETLRAVAHVTERLGPVEDGKICWLAERLDATRLVLFCLRLISWDLMKCWSADIYLCYTVLIRGLACFCVGVFRGVVWTVDTRWNCGCGLSNSCRLSYSVLNCFSPLHFSLLNCHKYCL
jgi:hypothetical protein